VIFNLTVRYSTSCYATYCFGNANRTLYG